MSINNKPVTMRTPDDFVELAPEIEDTLVGLGGTQRAMKLIIEHGFTPEEAAAVSGISRGTVYSARTRMNKILKEGKHFCPACSQVVRDGFAIDETALSARGKKNLKKYQDQA